MGLSDPHLRRLIGADMRGPREGDARRSPRDRGRGALDLGGGISLVRGRTHEVCGPARAVFAALAAAAAEGGPVLWIQTPRGDAGRLNADGLADFFDPGRLVLAAPRRPEDVLWCAEEALRSGAAPLVVAETPTPPRLTPVRRLHLAAEAGAEAARDRDRGGDRDAPAPLILLLTGGEGGAEGVETRWRLSPARPGSGGGAGTGTWTGTETGCWTRGAPPAWRAERLRARLAPPRSWHVRRAGALLTLDAPEDAGSAAAG